MIKYFDGNNFDELIKDKFVLVDFFAQWCGPCKMLGEELLNINDIDIIKVNVDDYPEIAKRYGVMSIPYVVIYKNNQIVKDFLGYKTSDEINKYISELK